MCWEALNNIAAADRPVVIVVINDNGRSYSPTVGGLARPPRRATHASRLRAHARHRARRARPHPVVGAPIFDALHGMKRGIKDLLQPQSMFEDLGLKYVGPIDGHDLAEVEKRAARWLAVSTAR